MKKLISALISISLICNVVQATTFYSLAEETDLTQTEETEETESTEDLIVNEEEQDAEEAEITDTSKESEETESECSKEEVQDPVDEKIELPEYPEMEKEAGSYALRFEPVASINGESYVTLQRAVDAALIMLKTQNEVNIQLESDLVESVKVKSSGSYSYAGVIRIDLNGHTWMGKSETALTINANYVSWELFNGTLAAAEHYRALEVEIYTGDEENPETVALHDLTLVGNGMDISLEPKSPRFSNNRYIGGIAEIFNANLSIDNCLFKNGVNSSFGTNAYGGALAIASAADPHKAEIRNTRFENNAASYGGALVVMPVNSRDELNLTLENCEFIQNSAVYTGGAFQVDSGKVTAVSNGSVFDSNTAGSSGGAITFKYGSLTLNSNTLKNNSCVNYGGGAVNATSSVTEFTVIGGEICNNSSGAEGGALYLTSIKNQVLMKAVYFHDNTSKGSGGAFYNSIGSSQQFSAENIRVENNASQSKGGGIYVSGTSSKAQISGTFINNEAASNGGGLYLELLEASVCGKIEGNTSGNLGGGLYSYSTNSNSKLNIQGEIKNNTAVKGGGLYGQMRYLNLTDTTVAKNTATGTGNNGVGGGLWLQTNGKFYGEYSLLGETHIYGNSTPNESRKVSGSVGATSDIFIRNTNSTTSSSSLDYTAKLTGFENQQYLDEDGTLYTLVKYGTSFSTAKPYKFYSGYYSLAAAKKVVYLDSKGTESIHADPNKENVFVASTLKEAYEIAKRENADQIIVCTTIQMSENEEQYINDPSLIYTRCGDHPNINLLNIAGKVTLKGAQIDGLNIESVKSLIYAGAGTLTIEEGTVIQNGNTVNDKNGYGGAISANGSTINMNGGLITGNYASYKGGGIYIQQGTLNLEGGKISYNSSGHYGGGIDAFGNSKINVGVNGGRPVIDHNTSYSEGGGISFESTTSGKIYSGEFTNNQSLMYSIYVSGSAVSVQQGAAVRMKNVYVSDNMGNNYGDYGALYTCPTGETAIFEISGALIVDNYRKSNEQTYNAPDIFHMASNKNNMVFVSDKALGGGEIEFRLSTGYTSYEKADRSLYQYTTQGFSLKSFVSDQTKEWAKEKATKEGVVITGNIGNGPGSAIANNGFLTIGTEETAIRVIKEWKDENGKISTDHPDQILLYLTRNGELVDDKTRSDASVVLSSKNGWSYTWRNLDPNAEWSVVEASIPNYEYQVGEKVKQTQIPEYLATDEYYIRTLTNTKTEKETGSVTLKKEVLSQDKNGIFEFKIQLSGKDQYSYYTSKDETLKPIYDKNNFRLSLSDGESATIVGLPIGSTVEIEETDAENYLTYINGDLSEEKKTTVSVDSQAEILVNYQNIETTSVSAVKIWNDGEDKYQLRPDSIEVILLQNGKEYLKKDLSSETGWETEIRDLPKYDLDGNKYSYSLQENEEDRYHSKISGNQIMNTLMTNITVTKHWEDNNNLFKIRPEKIQIDLIQTINGKENVIEKIELSDKNLDEEGNWTLVVNNLPLFNEQNQEYSYRIEEHFDELDSYETEIDIQMNKDAELIMTAVNTLKTGEAKIIKNLKRIKANDQAVFIYSVEASLNGIVLYSNILSLDFSAANQQEVLIGTFPVNTEIKVEEIYSGSSYELIEGDRIQTLKIEEKEKEIETVSAEYTNDYEIRQVHGSSIKNSYIHKKDNNGNGSIDVIQEEQIEAE